MELVEKDAQTIPDGYKRTELGVIPEDWHILKISECGDIDNDSLTSKTDKNFEFQYISLEDVSKGILNSTTTYKFEDAPSRARRIIKEGDLLFGTVRPNLQSHFLFSYPSSDYICSTGFSVIKTFKHISNKLVFQHFFARPLNYQINELLVGSNYPAINSFELRQIQIPLPPTLAEQEAIATALSDVDDTINALDKLIQKKKLMKQGAMQELLTPPQHGGKRLAGFNGDWVEKKLGDIVEYTNGVAHEGIVSDSGDFIIVNSKFISSNGKVKKYSKSQLLPVYTNEILMVLSDVPNGKAIAKSFIVDKDECYTLNQRICSLRVVNDSPMFINLLVNRNPYFLSFDDGVKQTNLRNIDVLSCPLIIPNTKEEQDAIANILSDMDAEIEQLQHKKQKYQKVKQGMMQELLTGKTRLV